MSNAPEKAKKAKNAQDKYEKHEKAVAEIRKENQAHLSGFEKWLTEKGLAAKTIKKHVENVDFYINEYLVYYEPQTAADGCSGEVANFLGDWIMRKTLWGSCAEIKANAASFKKFYAYMLEKGAVEKDDYDDFLMIIKEEMPDWLEEMESRDSMDW